MFMSSVAPAGEKSPNESDMKFRRCSGTESYPRDQGCGIKNRGFFAIFKYPVFLLNVCGIYVPSYCVCQKAMASSCRKKSKAQESNDSDSNDSSAKSPMNVNCVSETCPENHVQAKACPNADKHWVSVFKKVGCVVMFLIHCTNTVRYGFILQDASKNEKVIIFSLTVYFMLTGNFYLMAFNSHACLTHFTSFLLALLKYDRKYSLHSNMKKLCRQNCLVFWIVMVLQVFQSIIVIYGVVSFSDGMNVQMWPFSQLQGVWRFLGAIVVGGGVFFAACNLYGTNFLRATVVTLLHGEFRSLHTELSFVLKNASENPCAEQLFDQVVERLRAVCHLVDKGYELIKHTVAAGYIFGFPMTCLVLDGTIRGTIHLDQYVVLSVGVILSVANVIHTTLTLARLKTQVRKKW